MWSTDFLPGAYRQEIRLQIYFDKVEMQSRVWASAIAHCVCLLTPRFELHQPAGIHCLSFGAQRSVQKAGGRYHGRRRLAWVPRAAVPRLDAGLNVCASLAAVLDGPGVSIPARQPRRLCVTLVLTRPSKNVIVLQRRALERNC